MIKQSSWNYRILAIELNDPYMEEPVIHFQMHSVYYTDGVPDGYGALPSHACGDTPESVKKDLEFMLLATEKEVLWGDHRFPEPYKDGNK